MENTAPNRECIIAPVLDLERRFACACAAENRERAQLMQRAQMALRHVLESGNESFLQEYLADINAKIIDGVKNTPTNVSADLYAQAFCVQRALARLDFQTFFPDAVIPQNLSWR